MSGTFSMNAEQSLSFLDIGVGQWAEIVDFRGEISSYLRQLMVMGLTKGAKIQLVRKAPFGDPVEILVRGTHLILRGKEASVLSLKRSAS